MNTPKRIWLIGLLILIVAGTWSAFSPSVETKTIQYSIEDHSTLVIEGSSSVKGFNCCYEEAFHESCCSFSRQKNSLILHFKNTVLEVPARSFDCGGKLINRDMHKALKAKEYPHIKIELEEVVFTDPGLLNKWCEDWGRLRAKTVIHIAGQSKAVDLQIRAKELEKEKFRFFGQQNLCMSDFGIDPPSPMMGLVKVEDQITIHLDLVVTVMEELSP